MKTFLPILIVAMVAIAQNASAQATNTPTTSRPPAAPAASATPAAKAPFDAAAAEAKFKAMLTNATLAGRWCSVSNGKLGEDQEDKYFIQSIVKKSGDDWEVNARIQYGGRDFIAPIPVKVKWAGDTPVLIVDDVGMPGGATKYTARVMFYGNIYSGTWSGGTRGGLLHGTITQAPKE